MANVHLVHDLEYKQGDTYTMVLEIPAGTDEKWQTCAESGEMYFEHVDGKPRYIQYLAYPFNYGFIPQTLHAKHHGGDGDPLDIVLIGPALERGKVLQVKVLGAIKFKDDGEDDTKVLGVALDGPFAHLDDIEDLLLKYYGALEIIRLWFEGYKGPGSLFFQGYARREEAMEIIESAHQGWKEEAGYGKDRAPKLSACAI